MSVEQSEHLKREALLRILQATAVKSAKIVTYAAAMLGMAALTPGLKLPTELAIVAGGIGVEAIGKIIDWVVANGHKISDDDIRQAVEEAIVQCRIRELLTQDEFYHAFTHLRKGQRLLQRQNDDILTILHRLECIVGEKATDSESLSRFEALDKIRLEAAGGLTKSQQLRKFAIRPTGDNLKVFISSKMVELCDVRSVVRDALRNHGFEVFAYEASAGARPDTVMTTSLREVEEADVYIGLFWQKYGEVTIKEYLHARKLRRPCFIYVRGKDLSRDPELETFLSTEIYDPAKGVTCTYFDDVMQLSSDVVRDIDGWWTRWLRTHATQVRAVEASFERIEEITREMLLSPSDPVLEIIHE